jgi:hypothetical protein
MTPTTRPVSRLSTARDAGRQIVIIIGPGELIGFRLKGTRKVLETTVGACYCMAAKALALRVKQEKINKRKRKPAF